MRNLSYVLTFLIGASSFAATELVIRDTRTKTGQIVLSDVIDVLEGYNYRDFKEYISSCNRMDTFGELSKGEEYFCVNFFDKEDQTKFINNLSKIMFQESFMYRSVNNCVAGKGKV